MQPVIFLKMSGEAAERVTDSYLDSKSCRESLEKLLQGHITGQEFLYLLKNALETRFDEYCEMLEEERAERLRSDEHDEHEEGVPA